MTNVFATSKADRGASPAASKADMPNRTFSSVLPASTSVVMTAAGTPWVVISSLNTSASGFSNTLAVIGPNRPETSTRDDHPAAYSSAARRGTPRSRLPNTKMTSLGTGSSVRPKKFQIGPRSASKAASSSDSIDGGIPIFYHEWSTPSRPGPLRTL